MIGEKQTSAYAGHAASLAGHAEHSVPEVDPDHAGHEEHAGHEVMFRRRFKVCAVLTAPLLLYSPSIQAWLGFTAPSFPGSDLLLPVLATLIFLYGGLPFFGMATAELRGRSPGMMTLISLAIGVAYVYSMSTLVWGLGEDFFWELATLIVIMLLGHWMEMRSVRQASGALSALAGLLPDLAEVVLPDGRVVERPARDLVPEDLVLVRPGAAVSADGVVVEGVSHVDEAMITGESRPVAKAPGGRVIAGTVNAGDGSLRFRVTAVGGDTVLSGIERLVAEAQRSKSKTQLLASRAASWLFYAALAAAATTAVVWTLVGGFNGAVIVRVVTVLVIACPHALGLAVPLVVANTTAIAARNGILVRSREAMETARNLDTVAFDKTGTLTEGRMGVVDVATTMWTDPDRALALVAAVEGDSEHPLARALRAAAANAAVVPPPVTEFGILKGRGVTATVRGERIHAGGPRLVEFLELDLPPELSRFSEAAGEKAQSVVYLIRAGKAIAAFALADVVREESRTAVRALHAMGVQVAMLTGDSQAVADAVAEELGIDHTFAEVLPADKDHKIRALQAEGRSVAMVGDGVNDAVALTRADVGIAIGSGTDVAVESADLVLVRNNPLDVVRILRLSAASYRKQVQNIWWAAGYNILMIPLAAGVLAPWGVLVPPAFGAFLMSLSTIVVAINAQTLRRVDLTIE